MDIALATGAALGAAALFAVSSAVQARALKNLSAVPGPATDVRLLTRAVFSRLWLLGGSIGLAAFALHVLALHVGNLAYVQPLLVTVVLFALPADRAIGGPGVTPGEFGWAIALVVSLGAFFVAADPVTASKPGVDLAPAVISAASALLAVSGCVLLARSRSSGVGAALLGAAAGIAFAGVAALVKTLTNAFADGIASLFTDWQLYALLVVAATGIALSQLAYRAGPLSASLPALNSVNPLASILLGVTVFDEHFRTGVFWCTIEAAALFVMAAATVGLTRDRRTRRGPPTLAAHTGLTAG